ncbi:hypothetical protein HZS_4013 [Henneguya salminicola]|nr:hypothetical protein HZS_4013 [Henneguya salminicola]
MARKIKIPAPSQMTVNPPMKADNNTFSFVIDEPKFSQEISLVNNNVPATSMAQYNLNYPMDIKPNGYFLENSSL